MCSMDGFRVVKLEDVLPVLDVLITATGERDTHIHTNIHTYIHTYIHAYIHTSLAKTSNADCLSKQC